MARRETDIVIAGAGISGLVTALACANAGFDVVVLNPGPDSGADDQRSTAYLTPSVKLLEEIGVWRDFAKDAAPLKALRIADSQGDPPQLVDSRVFDPADLGTEEFGWNVPNLAAMTTLMSRVDAHARIDLRHGIGFSRMLARDTSIRVWLSDASQMSARLLIGADGRQSAVRHAAGIDVQTTRYGQKALAFVAEHSKPHDDISTEIYHHGGAFTTIPLVEGPDGPRSAIVWMDKGRAATDLANAAGDVFNAELNARSLGFLGDMKRTGKVNIWPVISQQSKALTAQRTALIAEAAHVFPPIGAQGLNTSLRDVAALVQRFASAETDPGSAAILAGYAKDRSQDIARRFKSIDGYNRICMSGNPVVQATRTAGLRAVHDIVPLRKSLMQVGLGV